MSEQGHRRSYRYAFIAVGGIAAGLALAAALALVLAPRMMLSTRESCLSFEDTVKAIESAVPERGWITPGTRDMNRSLAKHGVEFKPRVRIVEMCHPDYAKRVLEDSRFAACLMPCAIAVWEGDDGRVFVSKMNTGLMGRLFGGTIAEVMGGYVSRDEHAMLEGVVL